MKAKWAVKKAVFAGTAADASGFPKDGLPQIAVFGRSNVGKSSLLNALLQRKNLVKTSSTPGKTQLLQFFKVNDAFYFVDVPGFGYAKVAGAIKRKMEEVIRDYIRNESSLAGSMYLVDSRLTDSPVDQDALAWLEKAGKPLLVIATKTDKLSKLETAKSLVAIRKTHDLQADPLPVSAAKKTGLEGIWDQLHLLLHGNPESQELSG
jgi:GTP-binding protein